LSEARKIATEAEAGHGRFSRHITTSEKGEPPWCLTCEGAIAAAIEQAEKDATERAAKIAETWESTLFPRGVPVEYAQHQEITNQIGPSIAEAIRESPRPAPEPATCFRVNKCKRRRDHTGPCDDWTAPEPDPKEGE
jgi:hypothetical protein